jgi:chloride channel protein, CIC family
VIVPLMISNLVSLFISSKLQPKPIYEALAIQDGIHLPSAELRQRRGQRHVARVLRPASESLPADITVQEAMQRVRSSEFRSWVITDQRGVIGVMNLLTLEKGVSENGEKRLLELVDPVSFPHVHLDHGLDLALDRMGANQIDVLPIVSRANVHQLLGIVSLRDVLAA